MNAHSEKVWKFDLSQFKRLAGISERRDKRRAVIVRRPPLPLEAEVRVRMSSGALPGRRLYEPQQTRFRCNGFSGTVNSIGKETILRAGQAEMFAQHRPFVVAPKQAAAL